LRGREFRVEEACCRVLRGEGWRRKNGDEEKYSDLPLSSSIEEKMLKKDENCVDGFLVMESVEGRWECEGRRKETLVPEAWKVLPNFLRLFFSVGGDHPKN